MPRQPKSIQQTFSGMKSEYAGMTENRLGHDTGGGSTAEGPRVTRVSFENSR